MSETTNSSEPDVLPVLMRAPTSVLRTVTMPSNGATICLYCESAFSRSTLACADLTSACLAVEIRRLLVGRLMRHVAVRQQGLIALVRNVGERSVGLRVGEIGLRLKELLVEIGCVDLGEHVAGLDLGADVDLPARNIAADAREESRLCVGVQAPG